MPFCTSCGHKNDGPGKFCTQCGKPLAAGIADATSPAQIPRDHPPAPAFDFGRWFGRNQRFLLPAAGVLIAWWIINYFFFKPHPDKDGIALAKAECACEMERINAYLERKTDFLGKFDSYHFNSASEARRTLDSLDTGIHEAYRACTEAAASLTQHTAQKYANDYPAQEIAREAYNKARPDCVVDMEQLGTINEKIRTRIDQIGRHIPPPVNSAPVVADRVATPSPDAGTTGPAAASTVNADGSLTDEAIKGQITGLYQQENAIGSSPEDIDKLMPFYEFPLDRYYDARHVSAARLSKIYADSYLGSLSAHLVKDFQHRMTISRQTDGTIKVIVGCTFEFSTAQSPGDKRSRNVFNVYVLTPQGKIKSVYQLI